MRKSVRRYDSGYDPLAHFYEVFLDGKRLSDCHTADEEEGIAIIHKRDHKNQIVLNQAKDGIVSKTLKGKVEIRRKDETH